MKNAPPMKASRIPELDGLRGMAILFVLLFHYVYFANVENGVAPPSNGFVAHGQQLFAMGWAGVDLFFVLSGFLIGGILLDARSSPRYFGTFYARRFYRIIPLYYLWIGVYFLLVLGPFHGPTALLSGNLEKWTSVPIYFLFLQNSVKIAHATFGTAWLGALWSLAVEEQFYLVMPLAIYFLSRRRLVQLLFLAVVGAPVVRVAVAHFVPAHPAAQYVLTPCRADALAMGVLLAIGWREERWKAAFLRYRTTIYAVSLFLLVGVVYLALWKPSQYTPTMAVWGFSCVDAFFASLLAIAVMVPSGMWAYVCRWRFLAELGRVSYCMYVIHSAVNLLCHVILAHQTPRFLGWPSAGVTALAALLSYGLACLSWTFFENPLLKRGHAYQYFPRSSATASARVATTPGEVPNENVIG
jgi:peptidoglycan/LPS O-acetylase OafA/YrhL